MSILIKGMEMQTHCLDCPFMVSRDNDDCILQSAEANESFENWEQMKAGCPLVPVPLHGRLIDADALKEKWTHRDLDLFAQGWGYLQDLNRAPTIIPADHEEEEMK